MQALFLVLHVLVAMSLITLILLQHGKGADAGAAFGSGASATVFRSTRLATFLTKATAVLALLFQQLLLELSVRQYDGAEEHHRRREGGQLAHGDHGWHHRPNRKKGSEPRQRRRSPISRPSPAGGGVVLREAMCRPPGVAVAGIAVVPIA